MDWDDLRTFLAIARHGNLSAAARALGVTQTTMGRRLDGLHDRSGARLLQKTPRGFILTPAGEQILANVERIEAETLAIERLISGQDVRLEGVVRVTTVDALGAQILAPSLPALARRFPGITVELDTDTRNLSLSRREADIAVRIAKFEQHDAVVLKVGAMAFGAYAAAAWLDRHGPPDFAAGAPGHAVITMLPDLLALPEAAWFSARTAAAAVALRSNSRAVQLAAARGGLGLVCLPRYLGDGLPELRRLETGAPEPVREIWLGVHHDSRHTPRIRAVLDHLTDVIRRSAAALVPPPGPER